MPSNRICRLIAAALCVAAAAASTVSALAQTPPEPGRIARPTLVVRGNAETPIAVQSVSIRAEIQGRYALTEVELTFRNPNNRILEGELQFPLAEGHSVIGFALDVDGRMRDAVPVDKARGQSIFEEITRTRVDPGLLEATQGNNYKLRVYPIPAAGTRRVMLRYAGPLAERGGRVAYVLPLDYAPRVASFSLELRVGAAARAPEVVAAALGAVAPVRQDEAYVVRAERSDFAGAGLLQLDFVAAPGPRVHTQVFDGHTWFHAELPLAAGEAPRALPKVVALVWDSSGSGAGRNHDREFALLDAYFRAMREGEVRLTRLRDTAEPVQTFRIQRGDWRALRLALEATPDDGATNLGAFVPDDTAGEILLFSDGLSNYGERPFPMTRVPVYAVSAAVSADTARLRHIAERSGARYVDLVAQDPAQAVRVLMNAGVRVARIEGNGATDLMLASPYPGRGGVVVVGRLAAPVATLRATVEHPGRAPTSVEFTVRAARAGGALAAPLWARLRIDQLEAERELNSAEIRRLGRTFRLITRETSLIVLDTVADYARHEIVPPPELRAEYERLVRVAAERASADRRSHVEQVVRRFEEKVAWWNREFPKDARPALTPQTERESAAGALRNDSRNRTEARQAAPAAAAPPPRQALDAPARTLQEREARDASAQAAPGATIQLQRWQPDAPYAARLRNASPGELYRVYLDERPGYVKSTAFFLDAADVFFEKGRTDLALRVLSNLAEMDLESRHILRVLGHRLVQAEHARLALPLFRRVAELSPDEPQSWRDLGLAYAADRQFQKAVDALREVVLRPWHGRFPEVELIALAELNAIVATAGETLDNGAIDAQLLRNLPLDLRVVLTWDADNTDIDLWVTDPNGEKAFYSNRLTWQGGRMSLDFTGGYGPEEFSLKRAKPGTYRVEAQYYGDQRQMIAGPVTLQMKLATAFGLPAQREQLVTLRLKGRSESIFVGEFEVR